MYSAQLFQNTMREITFVLCTFLHRVFYRILPMNGIFIFLKIAEKIFALSFGKTCF
jgi:hypothetical protein